MRSLTFSRCSLIAALALALSCAASVEQRCAEVYGWKAEPTPANVARIRARLGDDSSAVRATALHALIDLGVPDAGDLATRGLTDSDAFVRRTAAHELVNLADQEAVAALGERIAQDEEPSVRKEAAAALGAIGSGDAIDWLVTALEDPMREVRLEATKGLAKHVPDVAVDSLVSIVLQDPDWEVRVQAAAALGRSERADVVPILREAANDPNELVRAAVAKALEGKAATPDAPAAPESGS
jgi:HEAT repeat protein